MQTPVQIQFRNVPHSDAVEATVRARAESLADLCRGWGVRRVTIEYPHRHKHHGNHFRVRIVARAAGRDLVIDRDPKAAANHEDVYAAIKDAFDAAERKMAEGIRMRRVGRRCSLSEGAGKIAG